MSGLQNLPDNELIDLVKSGSSAAFTTIYNRYWRLLYAHVYKILRDEEDCKDILQDVFSNLWLNAEKLPAQENFSGYLYATARNKVLNRMRHEKYKSEYLGSLALYVTEASEETLQYLDARDLMKAIESEIAALPPRMREVFEMSRKQNLSHKEISSLLGTSDETVKKQVHKSLKIIRYKLKGYGGVLLFLLSVLH